MMLTRLKKHWQINTTQVILVLCTFTVTGTLTAWLSGKVAEWLLFDKFGWQWWMSKIVVIIFGYQVIILIVGFCFGMFSFFWKYEKKILKRMGLINNEDQAMQSLSIVANGFKNTKPTRTNIAIFASGTGSNAQKIIEHFKGSTLAEIALIVCNNPHAGVLQIAAKENIPSLLINKKEFNDTGYRQEMKKYKIDFIVLAGFLWKVPPVLIRAFPGKIINIHPALLPDFGGKGMYGDAVHAAVIEAGKKESGITIHYVDEQYDHGNIIFQTKCEIDTNDTPEKLASKIHVLEHANYPVEIEKVLTQLKH